MHRMMISIRSESINYISIPTGTIIVALPRNLLLILLIDPRNLLTTITRMKLTTIMMMFLLFETRILLTSMPKMMTLTIIMMFIVRWRVIYYFFDPSLVLYYD